MSRRPPEQAIYFLDENVDGPLLAETLRAQGFEVRQLRACFERGAEDERWIPVVAGQLSAIRGDRRAGQASRSR
jgi:hypothetical protein